MQEAEEGEMVSLKGAKQPKNAKDKWASFVESREEIGIDTRRGVCAWAPKLEMGGALIP